MSDSLDTSLTDDFNPLSPHGERHSAEKNKELIVEFQSTLPAWGETPPSTRSRRPVRISIHSPRMGRDQRTPEMAPRPNHFNPLSPHGERP